ncbi:MAG: hypothetical protein NZ805_14575 [Armatimonadetes bacterium]|nr:hypothetical protein [Armatimonadota bacterium]MDW8027623.1 hypothetical protein [Armatimonadota bacterium]
MRSQELLKLAVQKGLISSDEVEQIRQDIANKARYSRILQAPDRSFVMANYFGGGA